MRVAVVGATGYAGLMLLRLLARHPELVTVAVTSGHAAGEPVTDYLVQHPRLPEHFISPDALLDIEPPDLVFSALGQGEGIPLIRTLVQNGVRIIDLSADFRFREAERYAQYYGVHPAPDLLAASFSGYADDPDLTYDARLRILGNPGCYPTAFGVALLPLIRQWGSLTPVIVDGKSGVSGAGRSPKVALMMGEMAENLEPYNEPGKHRHTAEMEWVTGGAVVFQPHYIPMSQGLLLTIYLPHCGWSPEAIREVWDSTYEGNPFVHVVPEGKPRTRRVRDTNHIELGVARDEKSQTVVIYSAIDNLVKGASGQAIQHANRWLGFPAHLGLL